jgi:hypothetical protein
MRDVLRRVIPALLVLGPSVRRAQVEAIVGLQIGLDPERDPDEPTRSFRCPGYRRSGDFGLDRAVAELDAFDDRELLSVRVRLGEL